MNYFKFPKVLIRSAYSQGIELEAMLRLLGLEANLLQQDLPKIAPYEFGQLINKLKVAFGNEALGFYTSLNCRAEDFGVVGLSFIHSQNLEEAIQKTGKYKKLLSPENIEIKYKKDRAEIHFILTCENHPGLEEVIQGGMVFTIKQAYNATGVEFPIDEIHLTSSSESAKNLFEKEFKTKAFINSKFDKIVFHKKFMNLDFQYYNQNLEQVLIGHADNLMRELESEMSFSQKISEIIKTQFTGNIPTSEIVAKNLGISVRSLQKKLQSEGQSFSTLLEEMRKDEAKRLLLNKELEIAEVAFLLGYASNATFGRAFKNWFNTTPQAFRLNRS